MIATSGLGTSQVGKVTRASETKTTLEEQSEEVLRISEGILTELDAFLRQNQSDIDSNSKTPTPILDPIAQIDRNLTLTRENLERLSEQLSRLKARIRA